MSKWKTQTVTPDTCSDGQCVIYEKFDTLATPRVIEVVGFQSRCGGHTRVGGRFPDGLIKGWDDNWRTEAVHMEWERKFYRFQIGTAPDPVTPAAERRVTVPEGAGLAEAYAWHRRDNALRQRVLSIIPLEQAGADLALVEIWWELVGDDRQIHIDTGGQLDATTQARVEASAELSFGPGRIVWEG